MMTIMMTILYQYWVDADLNDDDIGMIPDENERKR